MGSSGVQGPDWDPAPGRRSRCSRVPAALGGIVDEVTIREEEIVRCFHLVYNKDNIEKLH